MCLTASAAAAVAAVPAGSSLPIYAVAGHDLCLCSSSCSDTTRSVGSVGNMGNDTSHTAVVPQLKTAFPM